MAVFMQIAWSNIVGKAVVITILAVFACANTAVRAESILRAGTQFLPPGKGNAYRGITLPAVLPFQAIFDTLTALDKNGNVVPALAVSWHSNDAKTWTFNLRPGLKFSNGRPFNAEAVVKSAEYLMSPLGRTFTIGSTLYQIFSARSLDELTVEVKLNEPDAIFPLHASVWRIPDQATWNNLGFEAFVVQPIGTGPFEVASWDEGKVTMTAFRGSWRAPRIDGLEIIQIADQTARLQALVSGAVDYVMGLGPDDGAVVEAAGGQLVFRMTTQVHFIGFLTQNETPLRDVRVRKALNYAVDRESIIREILSGSTVPTSQLAFPGAYGFNPDLSPYPYDPEIARALLVEAGYGDGLDIVINIALGRGSNDSIYFQQIAADLAKVGVRAKLRMRPQIQNQRELFNGKMKGDAFNLFVRGHDPINAYRHRACSGRATERVPYHCDKTLLPLIKAAKTQTDPAETRRLYREILAREYSDPPALFMWQGPEFDGLGRGVSGYRPSQDFINFHEMEMH